MDERNDQLQIDFAEDPDSAAKPARNHVSGSRPSPQPRPSGPPSSVPPELSKHFLLKVKEVAEICQVSEKTVRRAIASKKLRAVKPGHGLRIHRHDLEAWLSSREEE